MVHAALIGWFGMSAWQTSESKYLAETEKEKELLRELATGYLILVLSVIWATVLLGCLYMLI